MDISIYNLTKIRVVKIILHILNATVVVLVTAVEFEFIRQIRHKEKILLALVFTVSVNMLLSIYTNLFPQKREAKSAITKALDIACRSMNRGGSLEFRGNVMIPSLVINKRRLVIKYHSTNMHDAPDKNIQLLPGHGCAGQAWSSGGPTVADLRLPEVRGGASWGLNNEQVAITSDIKAILSFPILYPFNDEDIVGILNFDVKQDPPHEFFDEDSFYEETASEVASLIGELLYEFGQLDSQ